MNRTANRKSFWDQLCWSSSILNLCSISSINSDQHMISSDTQALNVSEQMIMYTGKVNFRDKFLWSETVRFILIRLHQGHIIQWLYLTSKSIMSLITYIKQCKHIDKLIIFLRKRVVIVGCMHIGSFIRIGFNISIEPSGWFVNISHSDARIKYVIICDFNM